jgi:hypothetical protein
MMINKISMWTSNFMRLFQLTQYGKKKEQNIFTLFLFTFFIVIPLSFITFIIISIPLYLFFTLPTLIYLKITSLFKNNP